MIFWRKTAVKLVKRWCQITLLLLGVGASAVGRADPHASELIAKANALGLSRDARWSRILFYVPYSLHGSHGFIDDPAFYLSPKGKLDPAAELDATITAFFAPQDASRPDDHALCRYPARRRWLVDRFAMSPSSWADIKCPLWDKFREEKHYTGVSLVFSSFFPGSPASLFGHTFLRLHRSSDHGSDLLDDVVNFAASIGDVNALSYVTDGLLGGFEGRYSLMPYYMKIQEYNNYESRDLWEYQLNMSQDEIDRIMRSLWEVGRHHADYFYFDDNCSYALLLLLETANDQWQFANQVKYWVTPGASVQAVIGTSGIVRTEVFRPSALSRFKERFDRLTTAEQHQFRALIEAGDGIPALDSIPRASQPQVIDAALEYIDFTEKLFAERQPTTYVTLRPKLLIARNRLRQDAEPLTSKPAGGSQIGAHPESWLMLGYRRMRGEDLVMLTWQPVLHDLLAADHGYASGLQIQFMPMEFVYRPRTSSLLLSRLDAVKVWSFTPQNRGLHPASYSLQVSWERFNLCPGANQLCARGYLAGERGVAWQLNDKEARPLLGALTVAAEAGGHDSDWRSMHVQLAPRLMLLGSMGESFKFWLRASVGQRRYLRSSLASNVGSVDGSLAWLWTRNWNWRVSGKYEVLGSHPNSQQLREFSFGLLGYL